MPQDSSTSAAQPLLDIRSKLIDYARRVKAWGESGSRPAAADPDYLDRVRRANEGFRQQAERDAAAAAARSAAKPTTAPVKRIPKRTPTRTPARPVAGKRR